MSKKGRGLGFLTGALVGVGLGFLFAPKSGSETRKDLSNQMSLLWDKIRDMDSNEIKLNLENKLREIEEGIKSLDKEKITAIAQEKSRLVKSKTEELIEMAKNAGKPVLEDAARTLKKELVVVTKNILNKLESE